MKESPNPGRWAPGPEPVSEVDPNQGVATVMLGTDHLESLVAAFVAAQAGMTMPVTHTARWAWGGNGPVLLSMVVREAPNVVRLEPGRPSPGSGRGKR